MKKRTGSKTMVYEAEYGFMVDIVDKADDRTGDPIWDVWLYRKNHGVKMYLFGLLKEHTTTTLKEALRIVENVLPEYYPDYDKEYCKYDSVDQSYLLDYYYDDDEDDEDYECVCPVCGSTDVEMVTA